MSDISEKNSKLDEYGVWVKKNPQAEQPQEQIPAIDETLLTETIANNQSIDDDFSALTSDSDPILGEFSLDELNLDAPADSEPVQEEAPSQTVPADPAIADDIEKLMDFDNEPTVIEEPSFDETSVSEAEITEPAAEESVEDFLNETVIEEPIIEETSVEEPAVDETPAEEPAASDPSFEDSVPQMDQLPDFGDGEIDLDAFMSDDPAPAPQPAATEAPKDDAAPAFEDGEIDLDSFMDASSAPDGDVDLSAFMDSGSDSMPDFGNGEIDLDAFMGGESFSSDKAQQEEIEDADPLDIDLDFEDTDYELTDATADGTIPESANSSMDFETEEVEFDALFDDIVDETPQAAAPEEPARSTETSTSSEEIDLSDFGFVDDSDNQNPILGDGKEKAKAGPVDYEMTIDGEDDDTSSAPAAQTTASREETASPENGDDELNLDISQDKETAVQKEQETDLSSPDDSFDIDSIFDNIQDENGGTVSFDGESKAPAAEEKDD